MASLNFQARFAPDVQSGKKRQTIRARRKYPIRRGEVLYLYTGLRTQSARLLRMAKCSSTIDVSIDASGILYAGTRIVADAAASRLAKSDGFAGYADMLGWIKKVYGLPFFGQLITW
jgi:hypothetical protein